MYETKLHAHKLLYWRMHRNFFNLYFYSPQVVQADSRRLCHGFVTSQDSKIINFVHDNVLMLFRWVYLGRVAWCRCLMFVFPRTAVQDRSTVRLDLASRIDKHIVNMQ